MEEERRSDEIERAEEALRRAQEAGDEERLEALTEAHQALERELDRDVDETPPSGH